MIRLRLVLSLVICSLVLPAFSAHADRRYFVDSYTPYLDTKGELELEMWSTARYGQGDRTATAWENRLEFEYAISDRLAGAAYLNFTQAADPAAASRFDGPSVEVIYTLAPRNALPLDPAVYLEVRENGDELELEPKLLLAHRQRGWIAATNVIGEFEFHQAGGEEVGKQLAVSAGLARECRGPLAFGVEGRYERRIDGSVNPAAIFVGPTFNFDADRIEFSLGWHPQVWGSRSSQANLDLVNFERSEIRMILGVEL
jgi:hypothetical protein